jgi:SIR2-like domain
MIAHERLRHRHPAVVERQASYSATAPPASLSPKPRWTGAPIIQASKRLPEFSAVWAYTPARHLPMMNRGASQPLRTDPADTVLLAGAGISLDWPSCFPIGSSVVDAIAEWLGDGDHRQTKKARGALTHRGANPYSFMRFEQMWETLELLVPGISRTMESLELFGASNTNHHAIADFLDHGGTLITTNFDKRIEQALQHRDSDLRPWVFGARPRKPAPNTRFFKIHGSFGYRRKLLSSLFAIGSAGLVFSRYHSLRQALSKRVTGRRLIIAGYSFSDHFDVVPLFEHEFEPSQVIWIRYDSSVFETKFIPFEHVDDLPIPDPSVSFEHAALARFRHHYPTFRFGKSGTLGYQMS